jgi:phosphopantetheine adenylyltransferase
MAPAEYQFVCFSKLKEAALFGGEVEALVPLNVAAALRNKFAAKG